MVERVLNHNVNIYAPQYLNWNTERFKLAEENMERRADYGFRQVRDNQLQQLGSSISAVEIFGVMRSLDYLIESGPEDLATTGLGHKLVDTALLGNWPTILGNPIGRLLRHDLYAAFRKEHAPCFEKVNDIFKHAQKRGMLDINEQNAKGETPLLLLCKEAFLQGLRIPCVKELVSKLIAMGADIRIVDNAGKTAYDYAKEKKAPRAILNLLRPL